MDHNTPFAFMLIYLKKRRIYQAMFGLFGGSEKGAAALFLTVILLSGLLIVGLAVGLIMLSEIRLSRGTGNSVVAYYAAEAGAEMMFYNLSQGSEGIGWLLGDTRGCPTDSVCFGDPSCIGDIACCPGDMEPADANFNPSYNVYYDGNNTITSRGFYNGAVRIVTLTF